MTSLQCLLLRASLLLIGGYLFIRWKLKIALRRKSGLKSPKLPKSSNQLPLPSDTEIVQVCVYPVKSCRGISLKSAKLLSTGLDLDRRWMLIDSKTRRTLTIRELSELTLIDTAIDTDSDELNISVRGEKPCIAIPAHPTQKWLSANTNLVSTEIWKTKTDAWEYPGLLTSALARHLKREVRLLYKGPSPRILGRNGAPSQLGRIASTCFADEFPLLAVSASSLNAVNRKLQENGLEEISIERFRPNLVVKGTNPWDEDHWKTVIINNTLTIDVITRCGRCTVPNVNPDTGERDRKEPFETLMKFRRVDEGLKYKPCFGMMCVPREEGVISIGMSFGVLECTNEHRYLK